MLNRTLATAIVTMARPVYASCASRLADEAGLTADLCHLAHIRAIITADPALIVRFERLSTRAARRRKRRLDALLAQYGVQL